MRLLLLLAAITAQIVAPSEMPLTPPVIRARWMEDMRAKKLDDVLSLYAPGAVFVDPAGKTFSGSDLRKLYVDVFAAYDSEIVLDRPMHHDTGEPHHPSSTTDEGAYRETLRTRSTGESQALCGRYAFTYVKATDGETGWRVARMEWTSAPCPAKP